MAGGAFGLVVGGAWPVVVGQDHAEVVLGGVLVAAAQLVDFGSGDGPGVIVVGFAAETLIDVGVVAFTPAGHRHVGHRSGSALTQDGVRAIRGDTLLGVHG